MQGISDDSLLEQMHLGAIAGHGSHGAVFSYISRYGCLSLDGKSAISLAEIPAFVSRPASLI